MYTLYIDTHYENIVLILFKDGKIIDKKEKLSNKHSEYVVSLLDSLLNNNGITIDEIKKVIVINGPGSFTGVRIGIVIAKIIGYTKNISIKTLSYLEALALNYDSDVVLGIKDRNGVFIGEFDEKHNLVTDYYYLSNKEMEHYNKEVILDSNVDYLKVYQYTREKEVISAHLLVPLYVKKIEVQK